MTVRELGERLGCTVLAGESGCAREVTGCYIGDLLSWVMGRAQSDTVWITVMGNVNAIAVAKLADISCILLCEEASLDDDAKIQAEANGIPVLVSSQPAYPLAIAVAEQLGK